MWKLGLTGFLLTASMVFAQPEEPSELFTDPGCDVSFRHPRSWEVVRSPDGAFSAGYSGKPLACTFGLRPPGWAAKRRADPSGLLREFRVTIAVVRRPFLEVARRAGFTRVERWEGFAEADRPGFKDGDWVIAVRQGNARAEQFRTSCCQAVMGETWGNTTAADGSKATLISTIAVVNDRRRHSAIIEGSAEVVKELAASIRFAQ